METTQYFDYMQGPSDRQPINMEWIEQVLRCLEHESIQADGRFRLWGRVDEAKGKFLRVVLLADRETIHNAFFDRSFRRPV